MSTQSSSNWQTVLAQAITDPQTLLDYLQLDPRLFDLTAHQQFSLKLPFSYLKRIEKGNPNDPLLLQVLPLIQENQKVKDFIPDPVGDLMALKTTGVLHKYQHRLLIISTPACAIHCRYCFRRHFPYQQSHASKNQWQATTDYIQQHTEIEEVILSGGDPLVLSDDKLASLLQPLEKIPHLQRIRIHTRLPIVLPQRITLALCQLLQKLTLPVVMVIHSNHANEIDHDVIQACLMLHQHQILLLNQAVLLKNINNTIEAQVNLSHALIQANVLPYYLHLLDKVQGASHFDIDEQQAIALHQQMQKRLSGYLVPRLVRETKGKAAKELIIKQG